MSILFFIIGKHFEHHRSRSWILNWILYLQLGTTQIPIWLQPTAFVESTQHYVQLLLIRKSSLFFYFWNVSHDFSFSLACQCKFWPRIMYLFSIHSWIPICKEVIYCATVQVMYFFSWKYFYLKIIIAES